MNAPLSASVVIPCFNGGDLVRRCLRRCLSQKGVPAYEIIAIDSGSADGTREFLETLAASEPRLRVHLIPNSEFGHGRTRNLGASLARGELVCFLTQDAIPEDDDWLARYVAAFREHPDAAGAFGRHLAMPEHSPYAAHLLDRFFSGFGAATTRFRLESPERYEADPGHRKKLHFYSDNNSCMRRNVWERFPYDDVAFGEDQLWADKIIRAGLVKLYVPGAVVRHSHEFGFRDARRRAREEAEFFFTRFGYVLKKSPWAACKSTLHQSRKRFMFLCARRGFRHALADLPRNVLAHAGGCFGQYAGYRAGLRRGAASPRA